MLAIIIIVICAILWQRAHRRLTKKVSDKSVRLTIRYFFESEDFTRYFYKGKRTYPEAFMEDIISDIKEQVKNV